MSKLEEDTPIILAKSISADEAKGMIVQSKIKKALYSIAGILSLILAVLGIVVPGLPCTPFALLSAAMFAKSSDRLHEKLLNSRILGARIRDYQRKKGITKSGKIKVIIFMWTMVLLSAFAFIQVQPLRSIVLSAGVVGALVVWFVVPVGKQD